jgi:hypothetical protein
MRNHPTNKTFNSYDFEGSGLNSLIDILAYNTHHHAYYLNMIASEMFLDTAQIRENVISKCKLLGYIPKSNTCAKVSVNLIAVVEIRSDSESLPTRFLPITRSAKFKLNRKDGSPWSFYPEKEGYAVRTHSNVIGGVEGRKYDIFRLDDFILLQGNVIEEYFYYDESDINQKFILNNSGIDTDTLRVFITYSDMESDNISEYYLERDNMKLDKDSLVFFLQESINEQYEIYFGDGVFGRKLGIKIMIKYNSDQTTRSSDDIKNMVYDEVVRFSKEDLNSFGDYFRYSKFLAMIDNTHHSIENNLTDIVLRVNEDIPGHGKPYTYIFNFSNKIKKGTVRSSEFRIPDSEFLWHFVDDEKHDGHLLFHRKGEIEGEFIVNTYLKGICDYNKGLVRIDNVIILESDYYTDISVTCSLTSDDIYPRGNQILYIDQTNISIDIMDNDLFYSSENSSVRSVNII